MKTMLVTVFSALLVMLAVVPVEAQKKKNDKTGKTTAPDTIDRAKLIGTWVVSNGGLVGVKGTTFTFTKDNKVTIKAQIKKGVGSSTGRYKLDGNKLTMTFGAGGITGDINTQISRLTGTEMIFGEANELTKTTLSRKK